MGRQMRALKKAVDHVGGQNALARVLGLKQAHVWNWLNRDREVPAEHCRKIEQATGGLVTRYELRPDVFGPAPEESEAT